jgi:hypothetical protein
MITELTTKQQSALVSHRQRYFDLATCTDLADRSRAEKAARAWAKVAGVKIDSVVWVLSSAAGKAECERISTSLRASLRASLRDSLEYSLWDSLDDSLDDSLEYSLRDSLRDSLEYPLWDLLDDSLDDSLRDTGWLAFYDFCRSLGVVYDPAEAIKLDLWIDIMESCFAVWIVPGTIILLERPAAVEIVEGKLVGLTWRTA